MFSYNLTVNTKIRPVWTDADAKAVGKFTARYVNRHIVPGLERRMNRELMSLPGRPKYPIRWASPKQRAYVMMLRRARGLGPNDPWPRTGKLSRNWSIRAALTLSSGQVFMENMAGIAAYIFGDTEGKHQQPYHKDTGWPVAILFFMKMIQQSGDELLAAWPDILIDIYEG